MNQHRRSSCGLFVGLTTVDLVFDLQYYPTEDTKNTACAFEKAAGGPASNAAVCFAYLGGQAHLLSMLGKSNMALIARQDLECCGVVHSDLCNDDEFSPAISAIVASRASATRTICTSPAINADVESLSVAQESFDLTQSDIILIDGHITTVARKIAREAKESGATIVLDGDIYRPEIESLLSDIDIVIFGKSFSVPGKKSVGDAIEYFRSFGIKSIAATSGPDPIQYWHEGVMGVVEVEPVRAVDTLAAGDFFHGAFCYQFTQSGNFIQSLKFAACVAAHSVTSFGPRMWMQRYDAEYLKRKSSP